MRTGITILVVDKKELIMISALEEHKTHDSCSLGRYSTHDFCTLSICSSEIPPLKHGVLGVPPPPPNIPPPPPPPPLSAVHVFMVTVSATLANLSTLLRQCLCDY